ncbi:Mdm10p [Sugiyamaella lignohabitans]|uniref:Mitochondrial distribution and morphology protein 10 n=1 Tax=Sugiyamaella lignohabitans TaxID=796027 RepID=A0A167E3P8_9ASCO|nr:Mdm10p [Sugiyamaella lignohabitans]ANB13601.1 Mdm10p [Sugiyamaella lignohabitans]
MYGYMDHLCQQFYRCTDWNEDNSYANVIETARNLIDFDIPDGASLIVSSQSSKNSFTSYTLSNLGMVNGSVAYLYSSRPLTTIEPSREIPLQELVSSYRILKPLNPPPDPIFWQQWHAGVRVDRKDTLLYGRLFLPGNSLEALLVRRLSPKSQLLVTCVSDNQIKNKGAITFNLQRDNGKWRNEIIYSTYESLIGYRGMYNIGFEESPSSSTNRSKVSPPVSRLAFGLEVFYGIASKSPGFSTAMRYTTQSAYTGTPLTLTLMSNPLMGHISATYAVRTTNASSFASRFDFNVYSYISDLSIGCEIWRKGAISSAVNSVEPPLPTDFSGVFKASTSLNSRKLRLLWEGRYKEILISTGAGISLSPRTPLATSVGIELQYSS